MNNKNGFFIFALVLLSSGTFAYETKEGKVANIQVSTPSASARNVIVWLDGVSQMCSISSNNDSGYFNKADSADTFNIFVSLLLAAKSTGNAVKVLTKPGQKVVK